MIPVYQDTFYIPGVSRGNCYVACIASIMGIPLVAVPDWPRRIYGKSNWKHYRDVWLNCYGYIIEEVYEEPDPNSERYYIVSGPSPRNPNINHSCVWYKGKIVHDPFPGKSGQGIVEPTRWEYLNETFEYDPLS